MSFHTGQTFTFGETPSATKWNYLWENDYALADGTGIEDDAIIARHIADGAVGPAARSGGFFVGSMTITSGVTGNKAITGVGFTPKAVLFLPGLGTGVSSAYNSGIGVGFMDEDGNQAAYTATTRNGHGGSSDQLTTKCLVIATISSGGGSRSINNQASYVSMDADGFTINVDTSVATNVVHYLAMA